MFECEISIMIEVLIDLLKIKTTLYLSLKTTK